MNRVGFVSFYCLLRVNLAVRIKVDKIKSWIGRNFVAKSNLAYEKAHWPSVLEKNKIDRDLRPEKTTHMKDHPYNI